MTDPRHVLVTGANSGIGLATCRRLAEEGGLVAVADIDLAAAQRAAVDLPGAAAAFPVDVTDDGSVAALYQAVADRHGRIDVCHNNAGILLPDDSDPVATSLATWQRILSVNLTGVFLCLHHQIPHLLRSGGGSIINVASVAGSMRGSAFSPLRIASPNCRAAASRTSNLVSLSKMRIAPMSPLPTPPRRHSMGSSQRGSALLRRPMFMRNQDPPPDEAGGPPPWPPSFPRAQSRSRGPAS